MLPRWLVSTPIRLYGVGGLTNNANKMEFAFAGDCRKGSKGTTNVASTPTESSPNNRERRVGFT